jgi:ABC-type multidrug transport system fused ATPase/permease subunit
MIENVDDTVDIDHDGFIAEINVANATFKYPSKLTPAISDVSLSILPGASVAFVGPSGAGKTTLVDILLGVLNPDEGNLLISGMPPLLAVGYPIEVATDELVISALRVAHLEAFVTALPLGIDTEVGERGAKLSGGQRQRLGIARAMFTKPQLLVLDEATSSLDGESEANISAAIQALRGTITVVMIAHRLSTVRNVDTVFYLAEGKVLAFGTFDEVRRAVPDFNRQAILMGL